MELLRERFLKTFANVPINLRDDTILVLEKGPVSWYAAYLEVKNNTAFSEEVLKALSEMKII